MLFSIMTVPVYIPTNRVPFSKPSPTFVISCLLDNSHPNSCEVISHRSFGLLFP